jgi:hypothetical protein
MKERINESSKKHAKSWCVTFRMRRYARRPMFCFALPRRPPICTFAANRIPHDNSGVVISSRGALLVDSGINRKMARQIQDRVWQLTDKPLLMS